MDHEEVERPTLGWSVGLVTAKFCRSFPSKWSPADPSDDAVALGCDSANIELAFRFGFSFARAKPLLSVSMSFDTVHCRAQKPVLIRGPSVWIERLSSPINPLPFASPLLSQVAALRSYHTRVCGTDSAHLSSPFGSSTRPLSLCSLRSPRTLHADGAPLLPRVLPAQRRTLPVWYAELDPSRKLSPAGDTRLKAACLHSLV